MVELSPVLGCAKCFGVCEFLFSFLNVPCFYSGCRKSLPLPVGLLRLVSHGNSGAYPEIRRILTKRASCYTSNISSLWGFSSRQTSSNEKRQSLMSPIRHKRDPILCLCLETRSRNRGQKRDWVGQGLEKKQWRVRHVGDGIRFRR